MKFFDSYAIIEIIKGNANYKEYVKKSFVTTIFNIMEMYYALLRLYNEETADKYFEFFKPACVPVDDNVIKEAMKFRLKERSERNLISYADCIGYLVALDLGILFLTGEKHFSRLNNVEFVE